MAESRIPPEIAGAGVIGREGHERPVGVLERGIVHVPIANKTKIRGASVDVRLHISVDAGATPRPASWRGERTRPRRIA